MARKNATKNGNGRLEEATINLIQSMALLSQNQAAFLGRTSQADERFARIETELAAIHRLLAEHSQILAEHSRILDDHTRLLSDHSRILEAIPDAVREKFGFKPPQ